HSIHPGQLLLDGLRDSLFDVESVSSAIARDDLHDRRNNFRVCGDRQIRNGDGSENDDDEADDYCEHRAIDEESSHDHCPPTGFGSTVVPGIAFCTPSTMTRSPGF